MISDVLEILFPVGSSLVKEFLLAEEPIEFDFSFSQFSFEFLVNIKGEEVFVSVDNERIFMFFIFINLVVVMDDLDILVDQWSDHVEHVMLSAHLQVVGLRLQALLDGVVELEIAQNDFAERPEELGEQGHSILLLNMPSVREVWINLVVFEVGESHG